MPAARIFYGEVRSKEEADQTRQEERVCRGELGCLRLYYESFEKHEYCGTSKLIFLAKRQLYHYLLEGACA